MGTFFKIVILICGMIGLCFLMTSYIPGAWKTGYHIPWTHHMVSWAATAVGLFLFLGMWKVTVK